jgi:hypothetical protein
VAGTSPAVVLGPLDAASAPDVVVFADYSEPGAAVRRAMREAGHESIPFVSWDGLLTGSGAAAGSYLQRAGKVESEPTSRLPRSHRRERTSGNPGGQPKGLAKASRVLVGGDGLLLVRFWLGILEDEGERTADRLEASRLLADRSWGKAPAFAPVEDKDSLGLSAAEQAAERVTAEVLRLVKGGAEDANTDNSIDSLEGPPVRNRRGDLGRAGRSPSSDESRQPRQVAERLGRAGEWRQRSR